MKYPVILEKGNNSWGVRSVDLVGAFAVAKKRDEALERMRGAMLLYIQDCNSENEAVPAPSPMANVQLEPGEELVMLEPDSPDPISAAIEQAMEKTGVRKAELARRLKLPAPAVSRLTSQLYHGHSVESLRRIADALGAKLVVDFETA